MQVLTEARGGFSAISRPTIRLFLEAAMEAKKSQNRVEWKFYKELISRLRDSDQRDTVDLIQEYGGNENIFLESPIKTHAFAEDTVKKSPNKLLGSEQPVTSLNIFDCAESLKKSMQLESNDIFILSKFISFSEMFASNNIPSDILDSPNIGQLLLSCIAIVQLVSAACKKYGHSNTYSSSSVLASVVIVRQLVHFVAKALTSDLLQELFVTLIESCVILQNTDNAVNADIIRAINLLILDAAVQSRTLIFISVVTNLVLISSKSYGKVAIKLMKAISNNGNHVFCGTEVEETGLFRDTMERCNTVLQDSTQFSDSNDYIFRLIKLIVRYFITVYGRGKVISETLSRSFLNTLVASVLDELDHLSSDKATDGKVLEIVNEITLSRDKASSIHELVKLKLENPTLNIEKHLIKLSATFRKFILDELAKAENQVAEQENSSDNKDGKEMHQESTNEALRIIESLKSRPPQLKNNLNSDAVENEVPLEAQHLIDSGLENRY